MKSAIDRHKFLWSQKTFLVSVITAMLLFGISLYVNYTAVKYADKKSGNATTDILLDNLPVVNTDIVFSEGTLIFVVFVVLVLLAEPKSIPFVLKSLAFFIIVRAVFVSMTHLGPFPDRIITDLDKFRYFTSGADLFFSGHTGMPFLLALIFWRNKLLRWGFFFSSVVAAGAVILGHLHYTIDVFSAYFITYGIWHMAQKFFKTDYQLFLTNS